MHLHIHTHQEGSQAGSLYIHIHTHDVLIETECSIDNPPQHRRKQVSDRLRFSIATVNLL